MRILVAGAKMPGLASLVDHLRPAHEVLVVEDIFEVKHRAAAFDPRVVLLGYDFGPDDDAVIVDVKSACDSRDVFVVAAFREECGGQIESALRAGADDFINVRASRAEVLARIEAPLRLRTRSCRGARSVDWTEGVALRELTVWHESGRYVAAALGELFGRPVTFSEQVSLPSEPKFAATISLTATDTVLRLALVVDLESICAIGNMMLGTTELPADTLNDIVRELSNTVAGAVKRVAREESVELTLGLPSTVQVPDVMHCRDPSDKTIVCTVTESGCRVVVFVKTIDTDPRWVRASDLREGMVLVEPVHSASGLLLAECGARLTASTADRIGRAVGAERLLHVMAA